MRKWEKYSSTYDEQLEISGDAYASSVLHEALSKLIGVKSIEVNSGLHQDDDLGDGLQQFPKIYQEDPISSLTDKTTYGFQILKAAIAAGTKVDTLSVIEADTTKWKDVMDYSPDMKIKTLNFLAGLRNVTITYDLWLSESNDLMNPLGLKKFFQCANHIERLAINVHSQHEEFESSSGEDLIAGLRLPRLKYIGLSEIAASRKVFQGFFQRHADSLQFAELHNLLITEVASEWFTLFDTLRSELHLTGGQFSGKFYGAVHANADLAKVAVDLDPPLLPIEHIGGTILDFVLGRGEKPLSSLDMKDRWDSFVNEAIGFAARRRR